jgi:hypothetical protein
MPNGWPGSQAPKVTPTSEGHSFGQLHDLRGLRVTRNGRLGDRPCDPG